MLNCWLCGVGVTKENTAGKKKEGISNTCKNCNSVYVLVQTLKKLSPVDLKIKTGKLEQRLIVHKVVEEHPTGKPSELVRLSRRVRLNEM